MHRVGLENKQLAGIGAFLGALDAELGCPGFHDGDRPGRVGVRPVGVLDERRVQRLDAAKSVGAEVSRLFDAVGEKWLARS
jgi:hypothetical protein